MEAGDVRDGEVENVWPTQLCGIEHHGLTRANGARDVLHLYAHVANGPDAQLLQALPDALWQAPQLGLWLQPVLEAWESSGPSLPICPPLPLAALGAHMARHLPHPLFHSIVHVVSVMATRHPGVRDVQVILPGVRHGLQRLEDLALLCRELREELAASLYKGLGAVRRWQRHPRVSDGGYDAARVHLLCNFNVDGKPAHPCRVVVVRLELEGVFLER
mmetsp:Transcript_19065/g.60653  ORF Transcript_19065/g.60653 Transcript_19065/m.60653 type:complete len:218 (-) Transcript_19065:245-898(-)